MRNVTFARFIGIDLAWSDRNNTALAVLEWVDGQATLVAVHERCGSDDEIISLVAAHMAETTIIAVDAPLIVHNATGQRPCEGVMRQLFQRQEASPLPCNRNLFPDGVRGERLVHRFSALGVDHDPYPPQRGPGRRLIEVYPNAAMVALFDLPRSLKYKAHADRQYTDRYAELRRYSTFMLSLQHETPRLAHNELLHETFNDNIADLRGTQLKRREDLWDAVVCAYVGLWHWYWADEKSAVVGDMDQGYIATPLGEKHREALVALGKANWPKRPVEPSSFSYHVADLRRRFQGSKLVKPEKPRPPRSEKPAPRRPGGSDRPGRPDRPGSGTTGSGRAGSGRPAPRPRKPGDRPPPRGGPRKPRGS